MKSQLEILVIFSTLICNVFCYADLKCAFGPHSECVFNKTYGSETESINEILVLKGVFTNFTIQNANLERLSFDYMPIIFKNIPELYQILIKNCTNATLKEESFGNTKITRFIATSHSKLVIQDKAFKNVRTLVTLDLHGNGIDAIPNDVFSSLILLTNLNLASNRIKYLHYETFKATSKLLHLNLAHNLLEIVQKKLFSNLQELKTLNLRGNPTNRFENGFLRNFPKSLRIDFSGATCVLGKNLTLLVAEIQNQLDNCYDKKWKIKYFHVIGYIVVFITIFGRNFQI